MMDAMNVGKIIISKGATEAEKRLVLRKWEKLEKNDYQRKGKKN